MSITTDKGFDEREAFLNRVVIWGIGRKIDKFDTSENNNGSDETTQGTGQASPHRAAHNSSTPST